MWVPTRVLLSRMLRDSASSASITIGVLGNASLGLIKAPFAPTKDTTLANLTEADYGGYARQTLSADTVAFDGQGGKVLINAPSKNFRPTTSVTPNTIFGQFLVGSSSALFGVEIFDNPVPLPDSNANLNVVVNFGLDPLANYGMSSVTD